MRTIPFAAALAGMTGQAFGTDNARAAALYDANFDTLSLSMKTAPALKVCVQTQSQYNLNLRDDDTLSDDDTTLGFSMRRTRVNPAGPVTESIKAKIQIDFNSGAGDTSKLEAFADWSVHDNLSSRIGRQKIHFLREDSVGTVRMLTSDFSVQNRVFGQGYNQFIDPEYTADNRRVSALFSDGFDSLNTNFNTNFNSDDEADYAFTGRAEFKFGDADWKAFDRFTSCRGSASGGNVGQAAHDRSTGSTNPSLPDDASLLALAADFALVADGWNACLSGVLHTIAGGFNYYIVPESRAAKFTLNMLYYVDAVSNTGGVVSPPPATTCWPTPRTARLPSPPTSSSSSDHQNPPVAMPKAPPGGLSRWIQIFAKNALWHVSSSNLG